MKTHGELSYRLSDGKWQLLAVPNVMMRLKRLFPRARQTAQGYIDLAHTPEVARDLAWVLDRWPMKMADDDRRRLKRGVREHRKREETVHEILAGRRHLEGLLEPARPPRDYQTVAADLVLSTGHLLLADDLGLGKSMSGLLVLRDPSALPALIVCPTHLPRQWVAELRETFPHLVPHVIRSMDVYDPASRRELKGHDPDVLVIPYSKLRGWGDHLRGKVNTVLFDEAQELRRAESDKYRAARVVANAATFVMGLTATPVYNYGGEIHNVFQVIAPDVLGDRHEFFREWGGGGDKGEVGDPKALGTYLRESGLMLRRTRAEVGRELPEVVRIPHSVESDEDTFDRLADEAFDLAEVLVTRRAPKEELFKASGDFDWRMRHATGVAKAPYVAEFVRLLLESDEPVVLFGWHRDVYEIWRERLKGWNPVFYTGTESPAAKDRAKQAFLSGDSHLLVMSLRSGAGLDGLQDRAHVAVFGELDWSPGMHDQCVGRLHRDGQGESVVAYFLVSDQGADPVMADTLNLKRQQSEPIHDPDAELFEEADGNHDRVRRLAEDVLAKRAASGRLAA